MATEKSESTELDYKEIFNSQVDKLRSEGFLVEGLSTDAQVEYFQLAMKVRMWKLQQAIEELRIRYQATSQYRDDGLKKGSSEKQRATAESDMAFRQRKQEDKLQHALDMKATQRKQFEKTMRDAGWDDEMIKAALAKKGLL